MLKISTSYGFLVSSDEVMFLRLDVNTCIEEVDINILQPELSPLFDWVDVLPIAQIVVRVAESYVRRDTEVSGKTNICFPLLIRTIIGRVGDSGLGW